MLKHAISRTAWLFGALLLIGLLAACAGQPAPAPTTVPVAEAPTQPPPTAAPTATQAPTQAPPTATLAPTTAPLSSADNCVKCHTDQETLQQLAKAEEPTEKLSEGEG